MAVFTGPTKKDMDDGVMVETPAFSAITMGLDPIIFSMGHLHVSWYGAAVALAIGTGLWVANREARRVGLPQEVVRSVGIWVAGGGFLGARLLHVVDLWSQYADDPQRILALQRGGLAIEGALLGGLAAGALAAWATRVPVRRLADAVAPAAILGQAIGRLGCFVTGDALGRPTNLPWGVVYTNPGSMAKELGVAYQPVFAYEALWDLFVLALLWAFRGRLTRPGGLFGTYLMLYATGKFGVTFLRDERVWVAGLQQAHLLAILLFAVGFAVFVHGSRNDARVTLTRAEGRTVSA